MSSVLRSYATGSRLPDPAEYVMCVYDDANGDLAPFPWRFNKQTQVIDLEFINGFDASTSLIEDSIYIRGNSTRGEHNVLGLGANFVAWMETSQGADAGSVVMTERPIISAANAVAPNVDPDSSASASRNEPISFESSAGPLSSGYLKTMIFLKPLVIRYTVSGTTTYRYFTNNFEGNT
jgi:hypothetical protein